MSGKLEAVLDELRRRLRQLYGRRLNRLMLYGSQARGESGPDSDVDVLVVLDGPVSPGEEIAQTGDIVASLSLDHDLAISCAFVAADRFRHERSPFFLNVHREGLAL